MSEIGVVIVNAGVALPEVLAIGLGLVLSVVFRQRLGNRSLFTLLGFIALLLAAILSMITAATAVYIPDVAEHQHLSIGQVSAYYGFVGLLRTLVELAGWVLLLIGIFRRPGTEPVPPANRAPGAPYVPVPPGFPGQQPPPAGPPPY